jgi:hypothetical protein|nr:MAG TPA: Head Tail Connector Protein [Caudoviricetes sp.]
MYINYEFYKTNWGGKVPETNFNQLNIKATSIIDFYTFNRVKELETINDNIKYAICELIDGLYRLEGTEGKEVASEKVGTYSVTYAINNKEGIDHVKKKQRDIVAKYLGHTGLMYRGV